MLSYARSAQLDLASGYLKIGTVHKLWLVVCFPFTRPRWEHLAFCAPRIETQTMDKGL